MYCVQRLHAFQCSLVALSTMHPESPMPPAGTPSAVGIPIDTHHVEIACTAFRGTCHRIKVRDRFDRCFPLGLVCST